MSLQVKLQEASSDFQKIQSDFNDTVDARQKLEAQLTETENVKKEFDNLQPENVVFKQIGPVLVKQDHEEAKSTVNTRLGFIQSEIKRIEGQLKELGEQNDRKKAEIVELQTALQQQQQQQQQEQQQPQPQ